MATETTDTSAAELALIETLMQQIATMSLAGRLRLLEVIADSVPLEPHPPLSEARQQELSRRVAEWEANPVGGKSLEEWEREKFGDV